MNRSAYNSSRKLLAGNATPNPLKRRRDDSEDFKRVVNPRIATAMRSTADETRVQLRNFSDLGKEKPASIMLKNKSPTLGHLTPTFLSNKKSISKMRMESESKWEFSDQRAKTCQKFSFSVTNSVKKPSVNGKSLYSHVKSKIDTGRPSSQSVAKRLNSLLMKVADVEDDKENLLSDLNTPFKVFERDPKTQSDKPETKTLPRTKFHAVSKVKQYIMQKKTQNENHGSVLQKPSESTQNKPKLTPSNSNLNKGLELTMQLRSQLKDTSYQDLSNKLKEHQREFKDVIQRQNQTLNGFICNIQDLILKKKETSSVEYKTGTHDYFLRGKSSKPKEDSINTIDLERCVLFAYKDEEAMEVDESEMTLKTAPNIVERRAELTFKNPTDDKWVTAAYKFNSIYQINCTTESTDIPQHQEVLLKAAYTSALGCSKNAKNLILFNYVYNKQSHKLADIGLRFLLGQGSQRIAEIDGSKKIYGVKFSNTGAIIDQRIFRNPLTFSLKELYSPDCAGRENVMVSFGLKGETFSQDRVISLFFLACTEEEKPTSLIKIFQENPRTNLEPPIPIEYTYGYERITDFLEEILASAAKFSLFSLPCGASNGGTPLLSAVLEAFGFLQKL